MEVALFFDSTFRQDLVDEDGNIAGSNSGLTVLKKAMSCFERPMIIGSERRECNGFDVVPLQNGYDVNDTLVISFNALKSLEIYQATRQLKWKHPKIMNVFWWGIDEESDVRVRRMQAMSFGMFPTYCDSPLNMQEAKQDVAKLVSPAMNRNMLVDWRWLGIDEPLVGKRVENDVAVVVYPAMWLFGWKKPDVWLEIMETVAAARAVDARMALHPLAKGSEPYRGKSWLSVTDLLPRSEYEQAVLSTDVFLATSKMESYGMQYWELLVSGAVGVFCRAAWSEQVLGADYPFLFSSVAEGKEMMIAVLDDLQYARQLVRPYAETVRRDHVGDQWAQGLVEFADRAFDSYRPKKKG